MTSFVLDASAVLAFVQGERGSDLVEKRINGALMSAVNYSEVLKKAVEYGGSLAVTRILLSRAQIDVVPFDEPFAVETAALFLTTRHHGLSFADRACLALGIRANGTVLTADARLAEAGAPVDVVMIRKPKKQTVIAQ